jgi:hypothetical protein
LLKYFFLSLLLFGCNKDMLDIEDKSNGGVWYEPKSRSSWHIDSSYSPTSKNVELYVVELFLTNPESRVEKVGSDETKVICKMSAGAYDVDIERNFQIEDHPYPEIAVGKIRDDNRTYWVDINSDEVQIIMRERIKIASNIGCDGVLFTEVSSWKEDTGFEITEDEQIIYNRFLSGKAHENNLFAGFSDIEDQIYSHTLFADLIFSNNCYQDENCIKYEDFSEIGAVLNLEYVPNGTNIDINQICLYSKAYGIETRIFDGSEILNPMEECSE